MALSSIKERVAVVVEVHRRELIDLSLRIHRNPELGFQEEKASAWLAEYLEGQGFRVERGLGGLSTAFRATYGRGRPCVALLAEYDALPELGHACGHNIIGTASVGAAVAAKEALASPEASPGRHAFPNAPDAPPLGKHAGQRDTGSEPSGLVDAELQTGGSIVVIGTPAEEVYGGKVLLAERGAFEGLDCAMLAHPGSREAAVTHSLACADIQVEYIGKAAHAAVYPETGINALDALVLAYNAIGALRQHIRSSARIHGIITDGGKAPNVVPDRAAAHFLVRAEDDGYLEELKGRVLACFQAGAGATGARLEYRWGQVQYAALRANRTLAEAYRRNMVALGRRFPDWSRSPRGFGSTDMGNVSALVPAIHPTLSIAPPDISIHTPEFAALAAAEVGHQGLIDAAKGLAMTVVDVLLDSELRRRMWQEFTGEAGAGPPRP